MCWYACGAVCITQQQKHVVMLIVCCRHCRWLRFKQRVRLLHRAKVKMEREARRHRHKHRAAGAAGDEDAASDLEVSESILNRKGNKILGGQGELTFWHSMHLNVCFWLKQQCLLTADSLQVMPHNAKGT
jgi:hypothetical protein